MTLPAVQVQRGVARPGLMVMRIVVRLRRLGGGLVSDPLPRRLAWRRERVRRGSGIVVLLLVDRDVEMLHSRVQRVSPHSYRHRFTGVDQTARLALLLVLYCHHVYLLFLLIFVIIIWGKKESKWSLNIPFKTHLFRSLNPKSSGSLSCSWR